MGTTSGWLASRRVQRPSWVRMQLTWDSSKTRWGSPQHSFALKMPTVLFVFYCCWKRITSLLDNYIRTVSWGYWFHPWSCDELAFDKFKMCASWNSSNASPFQNEAAFDEVFQQANFNTFVFRSRVKLETYNVSKASMIIKLIKDLQFCWRGIWSYWRSKVKIIDC